MGHLLRQARAQIGQRTDDESAHLTSRRDEFVFLIAGAEVPHAHRSIITHSGELVARSAHVTGNGSDATEVRAHGCRVRVRADIQDTHRAALGAHEESEGIVGNRKGRHR